MKRYLPYFGRSKRNKFNAVRTNGCASKLEAAVHEILRSREKEGLIRNIQQQVSVDLGCNINWRVDFSFYDVQTESMIYAEAKGIKTDRYRICLKLWQDHGPGQLEIWEGHYRKPVLTKIIKPERSSVDENIRHNTGL